MKKIYDNGGEMRKMANKRKIMIVDRRKITTDKKNREISKERKDNDSRKIITTEIKKRER